MGGPPKNRNKGQKARGWSFKRHRRRLFEREHADHLYHATVGGNYSLPLDEELPGMGQFWCPVTGRHFESKAALEQHKRSKQYKRRSMAVRRRSKLLKNGEPHSQRDAEQGAGKAPPDNGKPLKRWQACEAQPMSE